MTRREPVRPGDPRAPRDHPGRRAAGRRRACAAAGSPRSSRTTRTCRRPATVDAGRRRGAAARPGRHPRARQRARPHRVGGLRHRHPGGRRRRRHHDHRHAAEQPAADRRRAGAGRSSGPWPPRRPTSTSASGAARSPATSATSRGLHDAGVFGFKCFLLDSGVPEFPPLTPADLHDYLAAIARVRRPDDRARRGRRRRSSTPPPRTAPRYADFLASRPRGAENIAIAQVIEAARWTGARVHILHLSSSDALPMIASARARRGPDHRRDLPALPGLRRRGDRRRGHPVQVLPADPGGRRTGTCCGRAWPTAPSTASCPTTRRAPRSSSGWTPATSASPGAASPRCRSALPAVWTEARGRGFTLADVIRWMSATPGRAGRAGPQGRPGRRPGRRPRGVRAGRDVRRRPGRSCSTATPITPYAGRTLDRRGAQHLAARPGTGRRSVPRPTVVLPRSDSPGETHHDADRRSVDRDARPSTRRPDSRNLITPRTPAASPRTERTLRRPRHE